MAAPFAAGRREDETGDLGPGEEGHQYFTGAADTSKKREREREKTRKEKNDSSLMENGWAS